MPTAATSSTPAPSASAATPVTPAVTADDGGLPPSRLVPWAGGRLAWREAGQGPALVLLHGIGSGAGSWQAQFASLSDRHRVLAWDAPGYGASDPLATPTPLAGDYAAALAGTLDSLAIDRALIVGHSLGALIGSAFAARHPDRVAALVLVSPARGYGRSDADTRERVWAQRTGRLDELGIGGLAAARSAALCSPAASAEVIERVRGTMARITEGGYRQAVHLLVHDDIEGWLDRARAPLAVLCGDLDQVTPPDACRGLAQRLGVPYVGLPGLAHACYVEGPAQFDEALLSVIERGPRV